jgi:S-methylmethionine-dependent homocysteine/selenocysteine methylase
MSSLARRIQAGEVIVLDGGVGSEIQRRAGYVDPSAWTGFSHLRQPEVVLGIHRDYIQAGAQVITANTFSSAKHILECVGLGDEFESINRSALGLARRARDECATQEVWIAGSLSTIPPLDRPATIPLGRAVRDNYRRQAAVHAEAGADLLIAEMILDADGGAILRDACLESGLPTWLGFSASLGRDGSSVQAFRAPGKYTSMREQPFNEMLRAVLIPEVQVAGVMHTKLPVMSPALRLLAQAWKGPRMAYAETGHFGQYLWHFEDSASPEAYAENARRWIELSGVQVVGGCCGTSPEHIRALSQMVSRLG